MSSLANNALPVTAPRMDILKDRLNVRYGDCLIPTGTYPDAANYGEGDSCLGPLVKPLGPSAAKATTVISDMMNSNFKAKSPEQLDSYLGEDCLADLGQPKSPPAPYANYFVELAQKTMRQTPDLLMAVFFSDANIAHLKKKVVDEIFRIKGIRMQPPVMDILFQNMYKAFAYNQGYSGSICFANLKDESGVKDTVAKLNSSVLEDYAGNLISQMDMYQYYYKDVSRQPVPLAQPVLASMKGSRVLEYNIGFTPGNSIGVASYNERNNMIDPNMKY